MFQKKDKMEHGKILPTNLNRIGVPKIMVFQPTYEEFKDFAKYVTYMESCGANKAGIAKIIPPPEWVPKKNGYDIDNIDVVIPAPICQVVTGKQGLYQQINIQKRAMTVKEYRVMAESERYAAPKNCSHEDLERRYWKNITYVAPVYGADVSGTLTDPDVKEWNINHLGTILDYVNEDYGISIDGVNTAYLYFGMWKTTFAWHTEDMDLYSINYLHFGEPKTWYAIPPEHGRRLERLANGFFPGSYQACQAFLRHKMTLISPQVLKQYSIPFNKITQEKGEIMVTFPYGYHSGFNHGFNCAESTNFAMPRWVEYGKRASQCQCRKDMVKISMDTFVKRFQPDRYELWIQGRDIGPHPEDPTRQSAAPPPTELDILCNKNNTSVPVALYEAPKKKPKRHPIHQNKEGEKSVKTEAEVVGEGGIKSEDIKTETEGGQAVKKQRLIHHTDLEDLEEIPDEETLEVLEDIWLKAGEMGGGAVAPPVLPSTTVSSSEQRSSFAQSQQQSTSAENSEGFTGIGMLAAECSKADPLRVPDSRLELISIAHELLELRDRAQSGGEASTSASEPNRSGRQQARASSLGGHSRRKKLSGSEDYSQEGVNESSPGPSGQLGWALTELWRTAAPDPQAVRTMNWFLSSQHPHCQLCSIFNHPKPRCGGISSRDWCRAEPVPKPPISTVWLTPDMFSKCGMAEGRLYSNPVESESSSALQVCGSCGVCVHSWCYGEEHVLSDPRWMCEPCKAGVGAPECCLCQLRGIGPLKRTDDGNWAHLLCAILIPEVMFVNGPERAPVRTSGISQNRIKRLQCTYCGVRGGVCVQCSVGKCTMAFHTTCALLSGVVFELNTWPVGHIYVTCTRHNANKARSHVREDPPPLSEGQQVLAKHRNTRYYRAILLRLSYTTFCSVEFADASFSNDLYPEDVVSPTWDESRPLPVGIEVQVRWTDGKLYPGHFRGTSRKQMCTVQFEDGSQLVLPRDAVYSLNEELPKKVMGRVSDATPMRHTDFLDVEESELGGKRTTKTNPRYHNPDFVKPTGLNRKVE